MSAVKKRILEIIPTLDRCGAEKQLTLLARGLPREEFDVHVCALTRGGPLLADLEEAGIAVTLLEKRRKIDLAAFTRLQRLIKQLRPQLVHTWLFAANAYGRAAALRCGVSRIVGCERCVDPWKTWGHFAIDRYLAKRSAIVVANSSGVKDFYVAHGLPEDKFEVIPNGTLPPAPCSATREEVLAELGLPRGTRLVAVVGRLWPQKRVKDAIWAADTLKVMRDDVHLLILGDGPDRERLIRFRDQSELLDNVHFLGHREDVPRLLPHVDVLWSPSAYEGQPNSVMEAMALGVPVVATDIPGTRDLVVHGETGFLVPTDDRAANATTVNRDVASGLARYTDQLLDNSELARSLGDAGRRRILEEFSVAKMIDRYAALYRRLLDDHSS